MRNLKRALSMLLSSTMVLGMVVMGGSAAGYQDVDDTYNKEAIEVLQAVGIMTGVDDAGNFDPDATVTRNQMAVIMSNLMAYNVATYKGTSPFTDVPSWAEPYVAACYTNGITAGISATEYGGDQEVTTSQAALMIMKALGYFQFQSDFGSDWQLSTITQGNKIDLFDDVDSGVKEAMSRNDVAQLVLNGLESGTVQAETSGTITVGDTTIVSGVKYNYVTSTQDYARTIDQQQSTTDNTDAGAFIVELGEKLYMGNLRKDQTVTTGGALTFYEDVFGRPATRWEYQSQEIGVYADKADYSFTSKVTAKALYDAVGRTAAENYEWRVFVDGNPTGVTPVRQNQGFKELVDNKTDTVKEVMDLTLGLANGTGNGVRTEVFVDAVNGYVHMSLTHYYAAEVYTVDEDKGVTTLSELGGNGPVQLDDEFDTTDFEEDQIVVYSYTNGEIQEIYAATSMEGTVTATRVKTDESDGDYYIVDGTKYNYNWSVPAADRLETENVNNNMVGYLDQYGYAIYIDEAAVSYDYAYVLSMGNDGDIYGGNADTWYARLVLTDGTVLKVETDAKTADVPGLEKHIVSYTKDKNDVYTLSDRSNGTALANITNIDVDNGIAYFTINNNPYTANSSTVFIIGDSAVDDQDYNNYDFTAYTGVKNMPNIANDANAKYVIATETNSNVAKVVYIQDADVSGAGSVYFAHADVAAKLTNDSELGRYRDVAAVVDGEVVTLKVKEGSTAEKILCGGISNQVNTLTQLTPNEGMWLDQNGYERIVALESITYNADGLVTNVRLYDARNAQNDGFVNFYALGTDKATKETVMLGGTEDRVDGTDVGIRYAWYDDVTVVRWDTYAGEFKVSTINSVKTDSNDRTLAVLADGVLNGLCIVEYKSGMEVGAGDDDIPLQPQQDVVVDMTDNNFTATFGGLNEGDTIADAQVGEVINIVINEQTGRSRAAGEKVTTLVAGEQYVVVINGVEKPVSCEVDGKLSFDYPLTAADIAAGKLVIEGVYTYVETPVEPGVDEVVLTVNASNATVTLADGTSVVGTTNVTKNQSVTLTIKANDNYKLTKVTVDGTEVTVNNDQITIDVKEANVTVDVQTEATTPAPSDLEKAPGTVEKGTGVKINYYYYETAPSTTAELQAVADTINASGLVKDKTVTRVMANGDMYETVDGKYVAISTGTVDLDFVQVYAVALNTKDNIVAYGADSDDVPVATGYASGTALIDGVYSSTPETVDLAGNVEVTISSADVLLVKGYKVTVDSTLDATSVKYSDKSLTEKEWESVTTKLAGTSDYIADGVYLQVTGKATDTDTAFASLMVNGAVKGSEEETATTAITYDAFQFNAASDTKDGVLALAETSGYKLIIDGTQLTGYYKKASGVNISEDYAGKDYVALDTDAPWSTGDAIPVGAATLVGDDFMATIDLSDGVTPNDKGEIILYSTDKVVKVTLANQTSGAGKDFVIKAVYDGKEVTASGLTNASAADELYVLKGTKIYLSTAEIDFTSATGAAPAEDDGFTAKVGEAEAKPVTTTWSKGETDKNYIPSAEYTVNGNEEITINLVATTT